MVETKVYADNFSKSFGSPGDFLGFLGERAQNSRWMTARSKDLAFEPLEDGSPASNTISQNLTNGDDRFELSAHPPCRYHETHER